MSAVIKNNDDSVLNEEFRTRSALLSTLLHEAGIQTAAYLDGLPYFSSLNTVEKKLALESLGFYLTICLDHLAEGHALRDSKRFTWLALKRLGLVPPSDMLERIEDGDVIEIYSLDGIQLFRNLEFFDVCSYSLEELYCIEWWRLFMRDPEVTEKIVAKVQEIASNKHPNGLVMDSLPVHLVKEALSREKFILDFQLKCLLPLYKNKAVSAIVSIERADFH